MKPLVTVAIAAYNVEKFLDKGVQYVLDQTYQNIEIIIVDDGSTDNTPIICDQLQKKDKRIRVFHKENGGLGSARNVGIDNARGEFIYFFDVDDSIENNLIEENVKIVLEKKVDLIIFGFYAREDNSNREEQIIFNERYIKSNDELKDIYCKELLFTRHGNGFAWNKFYRMSFINKYNFRFGNQRIQQDEPFNMQLYLKLNNVYISSKCLYHYVIYSSGNAGSRYLANKYDIITDVYYKFKSFYNSWNLNNDRVKKYICDRYISGIYNVISYNYYHRDCELNTINKYKKIKEIMNSNNLIDCIEYSWNQKKLSVFDVCIKNKYTLLFMILNRTKIILKKLQYFIVCNKVL